MWELRIRSIEPLPKIPSECSGKSWILRRIKESLACNDWQLFEKEIDILSLLKVKLLYNTVSNQLVNRNGYIVELNKLITSLVACNTAAMPLGNLIQRKSCLFYLSPYVSKNKVDIQHVLQPLDQTRNHIKDHPSRSKHSGSTLQTTQYWITRFLNSLDNAMEVADTQAVGALFNLDTEICSECFVYVGIHEAYQYLHDYRNNNFTEKTIILILILKMTTVL